MCRYLVGVLSLECPGYKTAGLFITLTCPPASSLTSLTRVPSFFTLLAMADSKVITLEELKAHSKKDDLYILIHGKGQCISRVS